MDIAIKDLLNDGAVAKVQPEKDQFVSRNFIGGPPQTSMHSKVTLYKHRPLT